MTVQRRNLCSRVHPEVYSNRNEETGRSEDDRRGACQGSYKVNKPSDALLRVSKYMTTHILEPFMEKTLVEDLDSLNQEHIRNKYSDQEAVELG